MDLNTWRFTTSAGIALACGAGLFLWAIASAAIFALVTG